MWTFCNPSITQKKKEEEEEEIVKTKENNFINLF